MSADVDVDAEPYEQHLVVVGRYVEDLLFKLTPIHIDEITHAHFLADDPGLQKQISTSSEILVPIRVGDKVRPLVTKQAVPLQLVQDALPKQLGVFSGSLCLGACQLSHDDETTVGDAVEHKYGMSFATQSVEEFDVACLSEEMDEIFYDICDENPELSDEEHDTMAEQVFLSRHGRSYEEARQDIVRKYEATDKSSELS